MKYFLDTEFIEGTQKTLFGNTKSTIDLISIGVVAEDGREYYAISKDFNLKEAWNRFEWKTIDNNIIRIKARNKGMSCNIANSLKPEKVYWIKDNVLKPIWEELNKNKSISNRELSFTYSSLKYLIEKYGKTNKQIAEEVKEFCKPFVTFNSTIDRNFYYTESMYNDAVNRQSLGQEVKLINSGVPIINNPEFYGYYSDYDWVVFCWLFGKMINLPKGFPMYCIDLKQELDNKVNQKIIEWGNNAKNFDMLSHIKTLPNYPKQTNEHNALEDARWNKQLYNFLNTL